MSQYDELQKAAKYAAQDTIKFADEDEEMRALQQFHEEVDPETVLALIVDLDEARDGMKHSCAIRLKKQIEQLETERDQLRAEVAGLKTGYEAYERVNAELKAENERLRYQIGVLQSDANSWQSGYDVGRHMGTKTVWAERRAVRKDAERYRWLRRAGNTKAIALVAEHCLDALDEAIDAALGQGEKS
ncbi:hypothetical protein [Pseudomonas veronii]